MQLNCPHCQKANRFPDERIGDGPTCGSCGQPLFTGVHAVDSTGLASLMGQSKVPVIVEVLTDNNNRTAPEIRVLFKRGQLGTPGSNKFLFDHVGIVEAHHPDASADIEAAAIEAGADDVVALTHAENDDIPAGAAGARFLTGRTATASASKWLSQNGWTVVTSELGYVAKQVPPLTDEQRADAGEFLQQLEDHDDVHRVWAAVK